MHCQRAGLLNFCSKSNKSVDLLSSIWMKFNSEASASARSYVPQIVGLPAHPQTTPLFYLLLFHQLLLRSAVLWAKHVKLLGKTVDSLTHRIHRRRRSYTLLKIVMTDRREVPLFLAPSFGPWPSGRRSIKSLYGD